MSVLFKPIRTTEEKMSGMSKQNGHVYFVTDSKKIYLDTETERINMGGGGGSGVDIYYVSNYSPTVDTESEYYLIPYANLDDQSNLPQINDLILVSEDNSLYRIMKTNAQGYLCKQISGGGGSSTPSVLKPSVTISFPSAKIINGGSAIVTFTATSMLDQLGNPLDPELNVTYILEDVTDSNNPLQYKTETFEVPSGIESSIDLGPYLRENAKTKITMEFTGDNHTTDNPTVRSSTIQTTELSLNYAEGYAQYVTYNASNFSLSCQVTTAVDCILELYIDDSLIESRNDLNGNSAAEQTFSALSASHGYHKVAFELYQKVNSEKAGEPVVLSYEIATLESGNLTPVIWLNNVQDTYKTYDDIQILYYVWANTSPVTVYMKKKGIVYSEQNVDTRKQYVWEITDADEVQINKYQISCGDEKTEGAYAIREVMFTIVSDPNYKDMTIKQDSLKLEFTAKGRSNTEPKATRETWTFNNGASRANFVNFNWLNNGWMMDTDRQSFLRISNGARFEIPLGTMIFNTNDDDTKNFSMEVQFKIRNIQNYANLIKNVTRYKKSNGESDDEWYAQFEADSKYDNYDAWLQANISPEDYEGLVFNRLEKKIDLTNVVCGYYNPANNAGIAIGTQDTFFSNGKNTLSIPFVEDELVTISYVYDYKSVAYNDGSAIRYMYIYINGVISGVIVSETSSQIEISPTNGHLFFDSKACDIDLYKIRVYNAALDVINIITHYAVDHKNPDIYDQARIAKLHQLLGEYQIDYNLMLNHNANHPDQTLMPYIIFDTSESDTDMLPHRKPPAGSGGKVINVEFVNTILDKMYQEGKLEGYAESDKLNMSDKVEAVKTYYRHHCPSFIAKNIDFTVQGTSSEFYPRRNYKIKTKVDAKLWDEEEQAFVDDDVYNIMMNRGPFAEIYKKDVAAVMADPKLLGQEESRCADGWYMNNYTNGTDRWTMKVDYMESSGSYNAGFASMIGTAYSKHPLEDYLNLLTKPEKLYPVVSFTDGSHLQFQAKDYRTSLLGFPVMAFHKKSDGSYLFIGFYRMLLDKGSDVVLGFKPDKKVTNTLFPTGKTDDDGNPIYKRMRDIAECWEFSTNARTYTSYRDPWDRVELSFMPPQEEIQNGKGLTATGAPIICNHIEYRYTQWEDYLDILQNLADKETGDPLITEKDRKTILEDLGFDPWTDFDAARAAIVDMYKNWEDLTRWVNKTDASAVNAEGIYNPIKLYGALFEPNKFYIYVDDEYQLAETFEEGVIYYKQEQRTSNGQTFIAYVNAFVTNDASLVYEKYKYYITNDGVNFSISFDDYSDYITYYTQEKDPDISKKANLLVSLCEDEAFDANKVYYNYDKSKTNAAIRKGDLAVTKANVTVENYEPGKYYVASPVDYGTAAKPRIYEYDTKEYRAEKFTNEVSSHFDMEYLAAYFVATEVFECYDSRGKNCMMASWGPHEAGGNYIWYPIFYDIDTQLGINNTGIPSFEFNVDATENFNFSTSDSILWNNFYRFFKGSYLKRKYNHMKGESISEWGGTLKNPPLKNGVNTLEQWYTYDYNVNKNIACLGIKPLIATNLDEYFKYITITNPKAVESGVAYLSGEGTYVDPNVEDTTGFFYALQGDRSQSRRQFLTNRLDYIDSWLNLGNYARAGNNRIRGRIAANYGLSDIESERINSDIYLENEDGYFDASGNKLYEYDAEYWLNLKPIRSSYVTAGDDSANYPSKKYDGKSAVKFELTDLSTGIKNSPNYSEQLVYIYGMANMVDVGDMSKLYWREFYIDGSANKLTRLKLGHDGIGSDPNNPKWYNKQLNGITLTSLPLLKEANFCNIGLSTSQTLKLTASEKLENFRATGCSNLNSVEFADGVALNTLYLPPSITTLKLNEARMLTSVITEYTAPTGSGDDLVATPGLYLEGLFEKSNISLNTISLLGGSLGYGSHDILRKYHEVKGSTLGGQITMTNVDWCPYTLLTEGVSYDASNADKYFIDNGHYGFDPYVFVDDKEFNAAILNQELFYADKDVSLTTINAVDDTTLNLLKTLVSNNNYKDADGKGNPKISGIIYFNNATQVNELDVPNDLQQYYPDVRFFFADVNEVNTAKFVIYDDETGTYEYVRVIGDSSAQSIQKIQSGWFANPYDLYDPEKTHYDFKGWKLLGTDDSAIITSDDWSKQSLVEGKNTYIFCAVFDIHPYVMTFLDQFDEKIAEIKVDYNTTLQIPDFIPYQDDSQLDLYETYDFQGWSLSKTGKIIDPTQYIVSSDETFYAIFKKVDDVRTIVHKEYFKIYSADTSKDYVYDESAFLSDSSYKISGVRLIPAIKLKGKVTIPRYYNDRPVIGIMQFNVTEEEEEKNTGHAITHIFMEYDESGERAPLTVLPYEACHNLKTLKYFDFTNSNVRMIGSHSFQACRLDASLVRLDQAPVQYIDGFAFNQAFTSSEAATLMIPSSLKSTGHHSFTYFDMAPGSSLQIGNENEFSDLDLSLNTAYEAPEKFNQSSYPFKNIYFYSNNYDDEQDLIAPGSSYRVIDCLGDIAAGGNYSVE